jgi:thioredoxin-related protein
MKNNITVLLFVFSPVLYLTQFAFAQAEQESLRWYKWNDGIEKAYTAKKFAFIYIFKARVNQIQRMDAGAFADPAAQELLKKYFIPIRFDAQSEDIITAGTEHYTQIEWAKKLGVTQYPAVLVYDENLQYVARGGFFDPPEFIRFLKYIQGRYYKLYSFEEYKKKSNQ